MCRNALLPAEAGSTSTQPKIVKVESRGKACFDYAETHPIFGAKHSKIVKVESRGKNPDQAECHIKPVSLLEYGRGEGVSA